MLDGNNNWQFTYTAPTGGSTFSIDTIDVIAGETVTVDWGDSTTTALTDSNMNIDHAYSEGTYTVTLLGTPYIKTLDIFFKLNTSGDIGDWGPHLPSTIEKVHLLDCNFTGDLSGWGVSLPSTLVELDVSMNGFIGDISDWGQYLPSGLAYLLLSSNSFTGYNKFLCRTQLLNTIPSGVNFRWDEATYDEWMPADIRQDLVDNYNWTITDAGSSNKFFRPFKVKHWDATNNAYIWE